MQCECGFPAVTFNVKKEGPNLGREFYCCSRKDDGKCQFFVWADSLSEPKCEHGLRTANDKGSFCIYKKCDPVWKEGRPKEAKRERPVVPAAPGGASGGGAEQQKALLELATRVTQQGADITKLRELVEGAHADGLFDVGTEIKNLYAKTNHLQNIIDQVQEVLEEVSGKPMPWQTKKQRTDS